MFCQKCGKEIEQDAKYCQNCGDKIIGTVNHFDNKPPITETINKENIFYSRDWRQAKLFVISSLPFFDLMADKEYLYLIKVSISNYGNILLLTGLLGGAIGENIDSNTRKNYRATWIDSNDKLVSGSYNNNVFLKVPLSKLKDSLILKKNEFTVNYDNNSITIKNNKREFFKFIEYIKAYI